MLCALGLSSLNRACTLIPSSMEARRWDGSLPHGNHSAAATVNRGRLRNAHDHSCWRISKGAGCPRTQFSRSPPWAPPVSSNIISGPDRDLWVGVTTFQLAAIDRIGLDGSVTNFPLPSNAVNAYQVQGLTVGPDGKIWFDANFGATESGNEVIIGNISTAGVVTELPPIAVPADQFVPLNSFAFGRISPSGAATQVPIGKLNYANFANGPSGSLIVCGQNARGRSEVLSVSPTTGAVTRDKIPASISNAFSTYLGAADGSL